MPSRRASPAILALDLGTSSVRSALFDEKARRIPGSLTQESYRVRHSAQHAAELDPRHLLQAARRCLQATSRLTKGPVPAIAGSCFWHSLLGLDRRGDPLTPVFTWADARGVEDARRLREILEERAVQQRTGCMLRASFWPAKLLWLHRTQPKLFRCVERWVSPAEWIFEQLFKVRGCSASMASGTGLYHLGQRDWDEELLQVCGLTRAQLGTLDGPTTKRDSVVFPAIGDGAAGNLGSGAVGPGEVALNIGTSAAVRTIPRTATELPFGLFHFLVDENRSLLGGAISNAGSLRAWAGRTLRLPATDRELEKVLRQPSNPASRLTILPFLLTERAPTWPESLDGVFAGVTQATTAADLFRAMTLASYQRLAAILEELEKAVGKARRIVVSGGVLDSPASLQLLANTLGRQIEICPEKEASLKGAAVYALEKAGKRAPAVRRGRVVRPRSSADNFDRARAAQESLECTLEAWTNERREKTD
ncbi:MAG: gluconokinase [Chthoniobacterales bacterium]